MRNWHEKYAMNEFGADQQKKVLIIEDELVIRQLMQRAFGPKYNVETAETKAAGLAAIARTSFDLILLDINLPGGSGLELCESVKSNLLQRHTPIILVTGMNSLEDKVNGLRMGADDYLIKPFRIEELMARSEAAMRKSDMSLEANPLTKLPGNGTIERSIFQQIRSGNLFSVLYVDLNNFKAYNDYYGFLRGDEVIRTTGQILLELVDPKTELVGHVGGDDFIIVTTRPEIETLCKDVLRRFGEMLPSFYEKEDYERGFISTKDRQNNMRSFPLLSVAIGAVSNRVRPLTSIGEVSVIGAELKHFAKTHKGSYYAIERRRDPYPSEQCKRLTTSIVDISANTYE